MGMLQRFVLFEFHDKVYSHMQKILRLSKATCIWINHFADFTKHMKSIDDIFPIPKSCGAENEYSSGTPTFVMFNL